jgi:hypothetical protein
MNAGPQFRDALIDLGFNKPRAVSVHRRLVEAKKVRTSGPGRRSRDALPFAAADYATMIIGMGVLNPIHAALMVDVLGSLKRTRATLHRIIRDEAGEAVRIEETVAGVAETTLHGALTSYIELYSNMTSAERNQCASWAKGRFIHFDAAGWTASTVYQPEADCWLTEYFGPAKRNALLDAGRPRALLELEVDVKIPHGVILLAAKLLAEAKAEQETLFSGGGSGSPGQDTEEAEPENESAPDLAGSEAPELPPTQAASFTNQSLALATGSLHTPETRETGKNYQSPTGARGWTLPQFDHGKSQQCLLLMA